MGIYLDVREESWLDVIGNLLGYGGEDEISPPGRRTFLYPLAAGALAND